MEIGEDPMVWTFFEGGSVSTRKRGERKEMKRSQFDASLSSLSNRNQRRRDSPIPAQISFPPSSIPILLALHSSKLHSFPFLNTISHLNLLSSGCPFFAMGGVESGTCHLVGWTNPFGFSAGGGTRLAFFRGCAGGWEVEVPKG